LLEKDSQLCLQCYTSLPNTNFHLHSPNPIEKIFYGRLPVINATAQYYFTKESMMQQLLHQVKYKSNKQLGFYLGELMGYQLAESEAYTSIDALVPLPLFPSRERKRGYNQATILCNGIAQILKKPVLKNVIIRHQQTESQTNKNRVERWQNMEGRFQLIGDGQIAGKHVLLVDDVITTGATLEACGKVLMQTANLKLSIATLCFSSG
jgi:ComF family protein